MHPLQTNSYDCGLFVCRFSYLPLQAHIMKKDNLLDRVFQAIHREAYGTSFQCLSRISQIHTAKLIHQLVNTNRQNNTFIMDPLHYAHVVLQALKPWSMFFNVLHMHPRFSRWRCCTIYYTIYPSSRHLNILSML